eukprot:TRINITY_DN6985_c0_g1_i1.p1 TRINITY_DN6985_c0_g1~~TRINITY_DN6985_c0_g1_i1.p1  ORF type:complete len:815 (+),score=132.08 TRINITY_DN6985_c0_g1_i1:56-2500(+)
MDISPLLSSAHVPTTPSSSPILSSEGSPITPSHFAHEGSLSSFVAGLEDTITDVQRTKAFMASFPFDLEQWSQFYHFHDKRYQRHLLALNERFSVLLLCWKPGQSTPVHNHCGNSTKCWIRVLKGQLRYVRYRDDEEPLTIVKQHLIAPGHAICMEDPNLYHKTENASMDECAISVHVFSPPYTQCVHGNGSRVIPVINAIPSPSMCEESYKHTLRRAGASVDISIQDLVDLLRCEIKMNTGVGFHHSEQVIRNVKQLLSTSRIQPSEWQQYQTFEHNRYTRNLIGYDENFTVLLLCWEKGQMSPIHDHAGASCWVKVLAGELQETLYTADEKNVLTTKSVDTYHPGQVTYIRDLYGVHRMSNPRNDTTTVSLHIYSPPFSSCHIWDDPARGLKRNVSIRCANSSKLAFAKEDDSALPDYFSKTDPTSDVPDVESWQSIRVANLKCLNAVLLREFNQKDLNVNNLIDILDSLSFSRKEWEQYVHFSDVKYTRSLLALNEHFSLVLNCWNKKQGTPVHDHGGCDRKCVVRVLEGKLTLSQYGADEAKCSELALGTVGQSAVLEDASLGLHKMENMEDDTTAVSLHLYWPPYLDCSGKADCKHNMGVKVNHIPVSYCSEQALRSERRDGIAQLKIELSCREKVFTSLWAFVNLLKEEFAKCRGKPCDRKISNLLRRCNINDQEWRSYTSLEVSSYTRNLVAVDPNFVLFLNCWRPGQASRIHDHGASRSWFKVLEGSFTETLFQSDDFSEVFESSKKSFDTGDVQYVPDEAIHSCANESASNAFTLHLYAPQYAVCNCYDIKTGKKESVKVRNTSE